MKAFDKLFKINTDGLLEINKPEIRSIEAFRTILERDKGKREKGDADGRKKFFAFKELMYIHLYMSVVSIYKDLPEEARHEKAKFDAKLPDNWKKDKAIIRACKKYEETETLSALYHAYINTSRGLYSIGEDVKFFNSQKERIRENIKEKSILLENATLEEEIQRLEVSINNSTTQLMELNNRILSVTNSLPNAYATIEDLHKKLIKESQDGAALYGGGKLNSREK